MFAVIKTCGKQCKIKEGSTVKLEKISKKVGKYIKFKKILLLNVNGETKIGSPYINSYAIGKIIKHDRDKKINIIKFRRRKHSMKHKGHRQYYTEIKITNIHST